MRTPFEYSFVLTYHEACNRIGFVIASKETFAVGVPVGLSHVLCQRARRSSSEVDSRQCAAAIN